MYIVIVGAGRVGYYLTKALLDEGHEVLALEKNNRVCETVNEELGSVCVRGDGCETMTLDSVGAGRADMLVAVTGDDEDNLVACQVAKYRFNVPRTVARVRNPQREPLFKKLGVDVTVSTTNIILEVIQQEVPTHAITHLLSMRDRGLELIDIRITPGTPTIGRMFKDLPVPKEARLALIIGKEGQPRLPDPTAKIELGDQIIALTTPEQEQAVRSALRGS